MPILNLASAGLVVIAVAWLIQLYQVLKINRNISPLFVLGYIIGVGMLVVSGWLAKAPVSYFELGTLVAAAIVLVVILRKK